MTPEGRLTRQIGSYLKSRKNAGEPISFVKLHGGPMQLAGLPDWLVILRGRPILIEVKAPDGVVSKLQEVRMNELRKAGAVVAVARTLDEAKAILS